MQKYLISLYMKDKLYNHRLKEIYHDLNFYIYIIIICISSHNGGRSMCREVRRVSARCSEMFLGPNQGRVGGLGLHHENTIAKLNVLASNSLPGKV